jgi:biuret amidohydrolase
MNQMKGTALLIIDAQKGFMDAVFGAEAALDRIRGLREAARAGNVPVIFTQELHRRSLVDFGRELDGAEGIHCLEGSEDAELIEDLMPLEDEYLVTKRRYSAFFGTDLELLLKGLQINRLVVCGFLTDVCVHYTCADAHQHNYEITVVTDAVSGSSEEAHEASLRAIRYLQRNALITSGEAVQLLQSDAREGAGEGVIP